MSSAFEAMGMSLPYPQWQLRMQKKADVRNRHLFWYQQYITNCCPKILTRKVENAISVIMAVGGSTNAVLHMLAIAHAAGVESRILKLFAPVSQSYAISSPVVGM